MIISKPVKLRMKNIFHITNCVFYFSRIDFDRYIFYPFCGSRFVIDRQTDRQKNLHFPVDTFQFQMSISKEPEKYQFMNSQIVSCKETGRHGEDSGRILSKFRCQRA